MGATAKVLPDRRLRKMKILFTMKQDRMILKNRLAKPTVGLQLSRVAGSSRTHT